ncbi:MAG: SocA family protein [Pseudonocardiales bacterium]|nr:SocA family protein [Pseudonocardiales bacterium]
MSASYQAMTVAKWFIAWAEAEDADLSNLKLQKLLYYAQGHHLARTGKPLFRETIEAWSHGPVVPEVYRAFKDFGSSDIRLPDSDTFMWDQIDAEATDLLILIWNTYGEFAAWRLRNMAHDEAPWKANFKPREKNLEIPQQDMLNFFQQISEPV